MRRVSRGGYRARAALGGEIALAAQVYENLGSLSGKTSFQTLVQVLARPTRQSLLASVDEEASLHAIHSGTPEAPRQAPNSWLRPLIEPVNSRQGGDQLRPLGRACLVERSQRFV